MSVSFSSDSAHSHSTSSPPSSSTSHSSAPSNPPPAPCVPACVARSLSSLVSLPDLSSGLSSLMSGRSLSAVAHFSRAADIVARMDEPYAAIAVQRLLAAAYHEAGEWYKESRVRAALLEGAGAQWPTGAASEGSEGPAAVDLDARLLVFQHVSSYIALQCRLYEASASEAVQSVLRLAASDSNVAWRANARTLQALIRQPLTDRDSSEWQQRQEAYQQALELLTEAESAKQSSDRLSSPLARLLRVGDLHCLLADSHHQRGDKQQALSHYQHSAQYWTAAATATGGNTATVPLMRGGVQLAEVSALCGMGDSSRAVRLTEERLGASHPSLAISLRLAAAQQEAEGEAIVAEGLLRSSIGQLEAHIAQPARTLAMYVSPAELRLELVNAQWQYAQLLNKLEWNGRSRQAEAEHHIGQIEQLAARHAYIRPHWQHLQHSKRAALSTQMPMWLIERLSI